MKKQLHIEEKFSKFWPAAAVISFLIALTFYLLYINTDEVLNGGYYRLIAFSFFAAGVLSIFKLRDGKVLLQLEISNNRDLRIHYQTKKRAIGEDQWNIEEIASVKIAEMPNKSLYNDMVASDRCVVIRLKNNSDWLYLNNLDSRVIPLTERDAEKIRQFIQKELEVTN